jgi:hypothetical protein
MTMTTTLKKACSLFKKNHKQQNILIHKYNPDSALDNQQKITPWRIAKRTRRAGPFNITYVHPNCHYEVVQIQIQIWNLHQPRNQE